MNLSDFDYSYPPELVANYPAVQRDASRMMVVDRSSQKISHHTFLDFPNYLNPGDLLVINDSKVFPCRLFTQKKTGGKVEVFLLRQESPQVWECLITDSKKILPNSELIFSDQLKGILMDEGGGTTRRIRLEYEGDLTIILEKIGHIPLPRYIKRVDEISDRDRYQTVFAKNVGSAAAPTAGFHFTEKVLQNLREKGVNIAVVTLHVGIGTFLSIKTEKIENHQMHAESYFVPQETVDLVKQTKQKGGKIVAVGTTVVRTLESAVQSDGSLLAGSGITEKFIHSPYEFKVVNRLLTNFHQPKSSLFVLAITFASLSLIHKAYQEALSQKYRLFSYGDCMLIT